MIISTAWDSISLSTGIHGSTEHRLLSGYKTRPHFGHHHLISGLWPKKVSSEDPPV